MMDKNVCIKSSAKLPFTYLNQIGIYEMLEKPHTYKTIVHRLKIQNFILTIKLTKNKNSIYLL